jgi:hypothetical protein
VTHKPPLIAEIERLDGEISRAMRARPLTDFRLLGALKRRRNELVAWARTNGWSTTPDDNTPAPGAPAERIAA